MRSAAASSRRTSGRCARGCAAPTPTICSTAIASAWSSTGRRCGARTRRWRRCIRNGTATATPGGAISTRSSREQYAHGGREETELDHEPVSTRSSSGPATARTIRRCAGASKRALSERDFPDARGVLRRGRDGLPRPALRLRRDGRPFAGNGHRLFVHDRSPRRLQRRRHEARFRRPCPLCRWR